MSSKGTKKTTSSTTTTTTSSSSITVTPQNEGTTTKRGDTPTVQQETITSKQNEMEEDRSYSSMSEKDALADLNNRLAYYIETVRNLETDKTRLTRMVETTQETTKREVSTVKCLYEQELSEARKLLDDTATEKARIEIDRNRLIEENKDMKLKLDEKTKECNRNALNERRLSELTLQYSTKQVELKKLANELENLKREKNTILAQLEEARKGLREETLARVDLENKLQSLREDIAFKEQLYEQQLSESRTINRVEISEVDGNETRGAGDRFYRNFQELREQFQVELENNKDEIKQLYEDEIKSLNFQLNNNANATTMRIDEIRQMQIALAESNKKIADVKAAENLACQRINELENQIERLKSQYMEEIATYIHENNRIRQELHNKTQECKDLMNTKIALDLEISGYRTLIEGEEARLHIKPTTSPFTSTPIQSTSRKRRRVVVEENEEIGASNFSVNSTATGNIEISEVDTSGKFVRLFNKGNKEVSLSGWQMVRTAGENNKTIFKFHRSVKIDVHATITVWSADTDHAHEPPMNLVMRGQKWLVADHMSTVLINSSGQEVASAEHKKQQKTSSVSRQRSDIGLRSDIGGGGSSIYFQRNAGQFSQIRSPHSPSRNFAEEKCRIM